MTTIPETAISESEALRMLNLPTTRRAWLRQQLPSVPLSVGILYEKAAVSRLTEQLDQARRNPDALKAETNANLHRRDVVGGTTRTR